MEFGNLLFCDCSKNLAQFAELKSSHGEPSAWVFSEADIPCFVFFRLKHLAGLQRGEIYFGWVAAVAVAPVPATTVAVRGNLAGREMMHSYRHAVGRNNYAPLAVVTASERTVAVFWFSVNYFNELKVVHFFAPLLIPDQPPSPRCLVSSAALRPRPFGFFSGFTVCLRPQYFYSALEPGALGRRPLPGNGRPAPGRTPPLPAPSRFPPHSGAIQFGLR